jgi:hypothetical protein
MITKTNEEKTNLYQEIKNLLQLVTTQRSLHREKTFSEIENKFLMYCHVAQVTAFTNAYLQQFITTQDTRTAQRLLKNLVYQLSVNGKIEIVKTKKVYNYFQKADLKSNDYNSYAVMMKANGYSRKFFNYVFDENENITHKKLIATVGINIIPSELESYDAVQTDSAKPKEQQAVYTNGTKSYYLKQFSREVITYLIKTA